jgi:hypothetical protein
MNVKKNSSYQSPENFCIKNPENRKTASISNKLALSICSFYAGSLAYQHYPSAYTLGLIGGSVQGVYEGVFSSKEALENKIHRTQEEPAIKFDEMSQTDRAINLATPFIGLWAANREMFSYATQTCEPGLLYGEKYIEGPSYHPVGEAVSGYLGYTTGKSTATFAVHYIRQVINPIPEENN